MASVRTYLAKGVLEMRVLKEESWKNVYMRYRILAFHVEKNRHSGLFINIHRRINRRYSVKMTSPGTNQLTIYYYAAGFSCVAPLYVFSVKETVSFLHEMLLFGHSCRRFSNFPFSPTGHEVKILIIIHFSE